MSPGPSRIQRELRQTRPFPSPAAEAVVGLLRTADRLRRFVARAVEPRGITVQQYNVLRILRGAGAAGLPTLEIAERMIENTPGITRLVDRLVAKDLLGRERCRNDRRQMFCRITPQGLRLLEALDPAVAAADGAAVAALSAADLKHLVRLLDALRAGLSEHLRRQPVQGDTP